MGVDRRGRGGAVRRAAATVGDLPADRGDRRRGRAAQRLAVDLRERHVHRLALAAAGVRGRARAGLAGAAGRLAARARAAGRRRRARDPGDRPAGDRQLLPAVVEPVQLPDGPDPAGVLGVRAAGGGLRRDRLRRAGALARPGVARRREPRRVRRRRGRAERPDPVLVAAGADPARRGGRWRPGCARASRSRRSRRRTGAATPRSRRPASTTNPSYRVRDDSPPTSVSDR